MKAPDISVVMSFYNDETSLKRTIESILSQGGVDFELILVNDGSSDRSLDVIAPYVDNNPKVRCISHANIGLTRSLIAGCDLAKGRYIARQDAGDISLPGRLLKQFEALENKPSLSMVSSASKFITPNNEHLFTTRQSHVEARQGLKILDANKLKGPPHHGSVMFRKAIYRRVGGYRREFIVAQDIDLWTRLVEHGDHESLDEILYCATVEQNSISSTKREQQFATAKYIVECMHARAQGASEKVILENLVDFNASLPKVTYSSKRASSNYYYFLGSSLLKTNPSVSNDYLLDAIKINPFNWRAIIKLIMLRIKSYC